MPHTRRKRGPAKPRVEKPREFEPGEMVTAHGGGCTSEIEAKMAIDLVNAGCAEWINDSKDIRVFRASPKFDASIELTLNFMEGVAAGEPFCVRVWKMRQRSREKAA